MKYNLFLDDIRTPNNVIAYQKLDIDWVIVRDYESFVHHIEKFGIPNIVSFDHDLKGTQLAPKLTTNEIASGRDKYKYDKFKFKTGYHALQWLCKYLVDNKLDFPEFKFHSTNPNGLNNMKMYYRLFDKLFNN